MGGDDYSKAHKMLSGIDTYTTTAEIIVRGNKMVESYIVKQYFKYPDKYRLVVLGPEDKKGKTTVYDGSKLWIYHPQINQVFTMENVKELDETGMFPGYFARNLFTGESASYSMKKEGSHDYISIKISIPGGNSYRRYQILYIDSKSVKPVKMELLDSAGNITVTVYYEDFLYNVKIDDKIFTKDNEQ